MPGGECTPYIKRQKEAMRTSKAKAVKTHN